MCLNSEALLHKKKNSEALFSFSRHQLKDQDRDFDESEADDEYRGQKKDKDFESFVALQLGRGRVCHRNQRLSRELKCLEAILSSDGMGSDSSCGEKLCLE
ncbi:hypothetical protein F2Q69_00017520 [Brassica cretica]|uniref:Uncharacterized protein n=1 Tax=Brassica cretica TaxID=69181 RepID=A0A8S9QVY8_BRACR|nr:hypothetical protein F2Q69_00017520 [Brassica cretica]